MTHAPRSFSEFCYFAIAFLFGFTILMPMARAVQIETTGAVVTTHLVESK
ncbi:MAG: hypothetical protein KDD70_13960 [Bdellovibrionales bacterium]|nr:hypothetical protein [Bdellovibrionales bacterium]